MQEQKRKKKKKKRKRQERKKRLNAVRMNAVRNKTACSFIHLFIMISFRTAYKATEICIFIMETVVQEQTATEQQIAINNQLTAFREDALLEARTSRPKNTRIAYEGKQEEWTVESFKLCSPLPPPYEDLDDIYVCVLTWGSTKSRISVRRLASQMVHL